MIVSKRQTQVRADLGRRGFTLVEILIVISIIAVIASMVLVGVQAARESANGALTQTTVSELNNALNTYIADEGEPPGMGMEPQADRNDFPLLYDAIFGTPRPKGKGGRSAPYTKLDEDAVVIYDEDELQYRRPNRQELLSPDVPKYLVDAWGEPFFYRCNKGRDRTAYEFMHNPDIDIYSVGPDAIDQTQLAEEETDDIGNW